MRTPSRIASAAVATGLLSFATAVASPAELEPRGVLEIREKKDCLFEGYDVSAVVAMGDHLVLGVDEGSMIQILEVDEDGYSIAHQISLQDDGETDIEGLAHEGDTLYVVGSHSAKRKRVKTDKSQEKNRERLSEVSAEPERDRLIRMRLDPATGMVDGEIETIDDLRRLVASDDHLGLFAGIPSKDNGIDIEGLAVDGDSLILGFRGPVVRGGFAPVLAVDFDALSEWDSSEESDPPAYELRFVRLDGRGIRSISRVEEGFLIVAGPVGDSDLSYRLYLWDGSDCVPGDDVAEPPCRVDDLGTVPTWADTKAEGLEVLAATDEAWKLLIVYDGAPKGLPTLFRVAKPTL